MQRDTEVVIEGFPRSANTFATTAFEFAQSNFVNVARHLHVPAQVIAAAKADIPTIVLIRDPEEAVLSLVLWMPHLTIEQALAEYSRFYGKILPYQDHFITATFEEVSSDFGSVIKRLNARFGTSFREFDHTKANVARCFAIIEQWDLTTKGRIEEKRIARPSDEREALKNALREEFRSPLMAKSRAEAYRAYEALTS